jgi:multidrug resistance efflux pump
MSTKKVFLLMGLALLIAGVGAAIRYPLSATRYPPEPPADSAAQATEGVVCTGFVDLEHGIRSLAPLRPGRVAALLVEENQHVEPDTPLLRLEDEDAKLQVEEAEAAVTEAGIQLQDALQEKERQRARLAQQQAAIAAAGFRVKAARQLLDHKEKQLKDKLVANEEMIATRAEVRALEQRERAEREKLAELKTVDPARLIRKAETELSLAKTRLARARNQLAECTLTAPSAGTVQRLAVGAGDIVTGNPAQPVVRFCPDETPLIRAEIDQEFADRVQVGQSALIHDDTHSGTAWQGKVARIAGWYERRRPSTQDPVAFTDVRTVECLITIDPGQPPLRIGQRMRVMIGRVPTTEGN